MHTDKTTVGVVIPTLNEDKVIGANLAALAEDPDISAMVVVDGGSTDDTVAEVQALVRLHPHIKLCHAGAGRGVQMNAGARALSTDWIVFHHADSRLPPGAGRTIGELPADVQWGGFSHQFDPGNWKLSFISALHNFRCRRSGVVYGDQSMFVRRDFFADTGEFDEEDLEDLKFSDRALTHAPSRLLPQRVLTESRKFTTMGEFRALAHVISIVLRYGRQRGIGNEVFFRNYR